MRFILISVFFSISLTVFSQEHNYLSNQVLVRFEPKTNVADFVSNFRASEDISFSYSKKISPQLNIWHLKYTGNLDARLLVEELWQSPSVLTVQVNHKLQQRILPDDPLYNQQWQWLNTAMDGAWDVTTGGVTANGDTIVVAVVDDGIELDHPDLQANIWHNYAEIPGNGIDDDNNGFVDDFNGWNIDFDNNNVDVGNHGVNCSGMVGAVGNDGNQGVGANWNVKIMTVVGGGGVNQEAEIIEAYSYVLDFRKRYNDSDGAEGAFVVATNSSWGSEFTQASEAPLWCAFFDTLGAEGILSCGATANSAYDVDEFGDLPTSCSSDYLISVTATNVNDERTFSAWGLETIDVAAPGDNIYTTSFGGGYTSTSGTSFATPLTAGVVALLYAAPCSDIADLALTAPSSAALLIKNYILEGVDKTDALALEIKSGGRLNATNSMQLLMGSCGACLPPYSILAADILDVSATLNFTTLNDGVNFQISWDGNTINEEDISSPYSLVDLLPCTAYDITLVSVCADSLSEPATYTFMTDVCCDSPDSFQLVSIQEGSASFKWEPVLAANSYTIEYAPAPFDTWSSTTTTDLDISILGLAACIQYQFRIKTNCDGPEIPFSEPITITSFGCGACIDKTYCTIGSNNQSDEWIGSVNIEGVFENTTGTQETGYIFFPDMSISLTKGTPYQLTITPAYANINFQERVQVWLDSNQNGFFEEDELIFSPDFGINEATTLPFTISPAAITGTTRMRVALSFTPIADACSSFIYGEVEDYCVTVTEAGYCLGPDNLAFDEIALHSAKLDWDNVDESISFVVKYRPSGGDWEAFSTVTSDYQFSNLDPCTDHEVELQAVCMQGIGQKINSDFKTECATSTLTPFGENSFSIRPNPFSETFEVVIDGVSNKQFQVQLFDLLGRNIAIQSQIVGATSMHITPLNDIQDGVYLLQLKTAEHAGIAKVVKY